MTIKLFEFNRYFTDNKRKSNTTICTGSRLIILLSLWLHSEKYQVLDNFTSLLK